MAAKGGEKKGSPKESAQFERELEASLSDTEAAGRQRTPASEVGEAAAWGRARELVSEFRPVPWFIWRLANFVLSKPGVIRPVSEGLVFGLRRLILAMANDPIIGPDEEVTDIRRAVEVIAPDVIAAGSVIHAISRRLARCECERIWRPILDDAILRANIGFVVGELCPDFGPGRGMLAGFAGRSGLVVLLATGTLDEARDALELLSAGRQLSEVGRRIYSCDPLHVSAMLLSASGCGRDAAFGSVSYALQERSDEAITNEEQGRWLAAFTITEHLRMNRPEAISPARWKALGLESPEAQADLIDLVTPLLRFGNSFAWLE